MSDQNPIQSKDTSADDLTKTKKPDDIQLTEEDLQQVNGGSDESSPKFFKNIAAGTHIKPGTMS
jgi:bacteriocin-like protein